MANDPNPPVAMLRKKSVNFREPSHVASSDNSIETSSKEAKPVSNSSRVKMFRFDMDQSPVVVVATESEQSKKQRPSSSRTATEKPTSSKKVADIEACIIGSSMIRPLNVNKLFPNRRCLFKCILGGLTRDCFDYIKRKTELLRNCKCFVIVCASNDCDSKADMSYVITEYLDFALYLYTHFPQAKLVFSKLVPRLRTAYVSLEEFDTRRVCFNNFLETSMVNILPCTVVSHSKFENKERLKDLLEDGVHFSVEKAVPIYERKLKKVIDRLQIK